MSIDSLSVVPDSFPAERQGVPRDRRSMLAILKTYLERFKDIDQLEELRHLQWFLSDWMAENHGGGPDLSKVGTLVPADSKIPDTQKQSSFGSDMAGREIC